MNYIFTVSNYLLEAQGFEIVESLTSRAKVALISVGVVIAILMILKTVVQTGMKAVPVIKIAIVAGAVIWLIGGGYSFIGNVVESEADNVSQDIKGL